MSSVIFNITGDQTGTTSVTAFFPETGEAPLVANPGHSNFQRILDYFAASGSNPDADEVRDLFDVGRAVTAAFARLGERVTIRGHNLLFDGDPLNTALADAIITYYEEGNDNLTPLIKFLENLMTNPNPNSRESLYGWLANKSFHIDDDGCFLTYKSVRSVLDQPGVFNSISSGTADVNGETITGVIPQRVGDVVEMPRSDVNDNTAVACSTGLHVGTWNYASGFSGDVMLLVKVNPRDVVSVPSDSGEQKVRVCRYVVVDSGLTAPIEGLRLPTQVVVPDEYVSETNAAEQVTDEPDDFDPDAEDFDEAEVDEPGPFDQDEDPIAPVESPVVEAPAQEAGPIAQSVTPRQAKVNARKALEAKSRDDIRALAKANGITRGLKTKAMLIDDLVNKGISA